MPRAVIIDEDVWQCITSHLLDLEEAQHVTDLFVPQLCGGPARQGQRRGHRRA